MKTYTANIKDICKALPINIVSAGTELDSVSYDVSLVITIPLGAKDVTMNITVSEIKANIENEIIELTQNEEPKIIASQNIILESESDESM